MILGDASYFIALADAEDRWHRDAVRVQKGLRDPFVVTDLSVAEAVTLTGARLGAKRGTTLFHFFKDSCEIVFVDEAVLSAAMARWLTHDARLSVSDAVSVEVMVRRGIARIASFDSDFDRIRGIERIH